MSINIEMLKSVLESLILEFGEFDEVTGVMKKEQISAIDEAVILANDLGLFAKDTERPQHQPEWVNGLPPAGWSGEYRLGNSSYWLPCKVKAVCIGQGAIIECDCEYGEQYVSLFGRQPVEFRPIRTKADRDREELREIASKYSDLGHVIADEILAAGWQKGGNSE